MRGCSFHDLPIGTVWGVKCGRRWGAMNLAVIMLCAGWQAYRGGMQDAAHASAELKGLEAAQAQTVEPSSEFLVGPTELWQFRLMNAAIGAR